jgi:acetyl-CoA carboxylase carboxyltransferase component
MGFLDTAVDQRAEPFRTARTRMLGALARLESVLDAARESGGERAVTRHHARGKLLARERIELLVDRDSPLLELSPVAGWGTGAPVGAAVVTAIGVVEDQLCVIVAHDPTVLIENGEGAVPGFAAKIRRAQQIARQNRLPLVWLAEDAGYDEVGELMAGLARVGAAGIRTIAVYFGVPPTERAGPFDYLIALRGYAGRPATHLAGDERDALRLARQCARRPRRVRLGALTAAPPPEHDPEDLLSVPAGDPWEILARVLDGSEFDEIDGPAAGGEVCAGWGEVCGYPVAVVADRPTGGGEAGAATPARMVRLAARSSTPLLYLAQGSGGVRPLAGAVADARIPIVAVRVGSGAGDAALSALARFRFRWPDPGSGADLGSGADPGEDLADSGRLADDGVIDPRDTRAVLGFCLSVIRP